MPWNLSTKTHSTPYTIFLGRTTARFHVFLFSYVLVEVTEASIFGTADELSNVLVRITEGSFLKQDALFFLRPWVQVLALVQFVLYLVADLDSNRFKVGDHFDLAAAVQLAEAFDHGFVIETAVAPRSLQFVFRHHHSVLSPLSMANVWRAIARYLYTTRSLMCKFIMAKITFRSISFRSAGLCGSLM